MSIIKLVQPDRTSVPKALRNIADDYEKGIYGNFPATIVINREVFHVGSSAPVEQCVADAVFDLNVGIHKLMKMGLRDEP